MAEKHCLNPYYTGIHLHKMWRIPNQCRVVLILIILEYIYIPFSKEELECLNGLNPYYTGIHLHSKTNWKALFNNFCLNPYYTGIHLHDKIGKYYDRTSVLILIILEYIYIKEEREQKKPKMRLNPYYTGIHLHTVFRLWLRMLLCLNPYYTGIHLHILIIRLL